MAESDTHLDENAVLDHVAGLGSPETRARVEDHIDLCPACRRLLAEAGASSLPLDQVKEVQQAPPGPGDLLAQRFRLRRALGHGAMGIVYEADDELVGTRVALKLLRHVDVLPRLRREVVVGRRISHPNICRLFDLFSEGETYFLAMELVQGSTLEDRLADGPLPPAVAATILDQIGAALEAAHGEAVVHRDLKPQNVMIDDADRVKVMDFGLARDLAAADSVRLGPVGTPAYWAPEQARGEPATPAADIYSYALVAYRILAGRPFRLGDADALSRVPAAYRRPLARALASRPEKRWPSAAAFRRALAGAARPGLFTWLRRLFPGS